jgi:hypothetical protein
MLGRVWVSVQLMATLTGCASRSQRKPFSPNPNIPIASICLIDCDLSSSSRHRHTAAVPYREGCEQVVGVVK